MSPNVPAAQIPPSDPPNNASPADRAAPAPHDHHHHHPHPHQLGGFDRPTVAVQLINLAAVIFPFLGLVAAGVLTWGWGFDWMPLILLVTFYFLTAIGVTVGMHRYFTHRSFETTRPVKVILAILGMMSIEGPLLRWVATHRKHHQHSDEENDPHSPHLHGHGIKGFFQGLWHAHMGWLFDGDARGMDRYVGDLKKDPLITKLSNLFPLWAILSLVLPGIIGGLLWMNWQGALLGFIWGGLARVFIVHHVTWSINSVCHIWGARMFETDDESRNNPVFGVLALGEGWHNNHHAFPTSARHGLKWWQIDFSYYLIKLMQWTGLAWKVKTPTPEAITTKQQRGRLDPPEPVA